MEIENENKKQLPNIPLISHYMLVWENDGSE